MIKVLGDAGGIYKPEVKINGEPIASFNAEFPVGQMARCACGMKPESIKALQDGGQVKINSIVIFTGDGWAPRGSATSSSLDFGFSLIHPCHVIDEGRAWAPGLHPMSTEHYTFTMGGGGSDERDNTLYGDIRYLQFDLTASMATEIPAYIIKAMELARNERVSQNLTNSGVLEGNLAANSQDVIAFLQSIEGLTACKIDSDSLSSPGIRVSANAYAQQLILNSVQANKSAWDLLAMMMSAFGMQLICLPDGTVKACPDFSGCKPPAGNRITGDLIDSWQGSAEYNRSPRGVVVISHGFSPGNSGITPSTGASAFDPLLQNEGEYIPGKSGGLFITALPAWMMAFQDGGLPQLPRDLVDKYARQIYSEVKNMGRTFVVSTPMCPDARPGTTYYFEVISNAKNLTDGGDVSVPFSAEYAGYCYKITHSGNAQGQFHTHWYFRNVFDPTEYDLMVEASPFYGDKPFEVGGGGDEGGGDEEESFAETEARKRAEAQAAGFFGTN